MPPFKNLTGQVFRRWTVLAKAGRGHNGNILWQCRCECGTIREVRSDHLRKGLSVSCGCYNKERVSETHSLDLTGQRFGRLFALEDAGRNKYHQAMWRCRCDCGTMATVLARNLVSGVTTSCGCYRLEVISNNLVGQKFGKLLVCEQVGRKRSYILWHCQCECGNFIDVPSWNLIRHTIISCGCEERPTNQRHKDLTGFVFGKLLVLGESERDAQNRVMWNCKCECGTLVKVPSCRLLRKGCTPSCGCHKFLAPSGAGHYNWKGGITPIHTAVRNSLLTKIWRRAVLKRDSYRCQHCNKVGGKLHAHHIIFFSTIMEVHNITTLEEAEACETLWEVSNGLTLCKKCHRKLHGWKNYH